MQNFLQQNGPTVTAMPQVKPVMHGDSGTRSQSSSVVHSAVHRPLLPVGYLLPGGSSRVLGTRRQVRVTQSSDGDATTTSSLPGAAVPRSQIRPTGFSEHPAATAQNAAIASQRWRRFIAGDNRSRGYQVKRTT